MESDNEYIYEEGDECDEYYDANDWDTFEYVHAMKHFDVAKEKFKTIKDPILKFVLIIWYTTDVCGVWREKLLPLIESEIASTVDDDETIQLIGHMCKHENIKRIKKEDYEYENIIKYIKQIDELNNTLKEYLIEGVKLSSGFVIEYNGCVKHKIITARLCNFLRSIIQ